MATGISGHVRLVERKRGPKWYAYWRVGPRSKDQRKKMLGPAWTEKGRPPEGYFTRKTAQAWLDARLTDERRGNGERPESGATFNDAADEYLRFVTDVRKVDRVTARDYRGVIDGYLRDEFGDSPVEQITPDAIDAYKERLIAGGRLSNRSIVRHLTVLHGVFKRAKRVWKLRDNPASADLVERPKVVYTGEFDTFDGNEIERLVVAAANEQDAALYQAATFSGLRTGELFALRWRDVDFVAGLIHVRRNFTGGQLKVPKGKRVRSVPMVAALVDVLARLKDRPDFTGDDDLVFPSESGGFLNYYKHYRRYHAALDAAGLRRIRFHDLRHVFGSAGITTLDPYALQSYMGHQHYSTTARYLHHKPKAEDAAKLSEAFGAKPGIEASIETPISNGRKSTQELARRHKATPRTD